MLPGYTYHLTHRCHDRKWLLKFAGDRNEYRRRLRLALRGSRLSLLSYCLTSNHVHLLVSSPEPAEVAAFMQRLQGEFAEWYNRRKRRSGAYWDGRYGCTMIEGGRHLWNCMRYIDLNMVRTGAVAHPRDWRWCGYDELTGARGKFLVIDRPKVLELLEVPDATELCRAHRESIEEVLARGRPAREPDWTESIGVGSREFVDEVAARMHQRVELEVRQTEGGAWSVRETSPSYGQATCGDAEAETGGEAASPSVRFSGSKVARTGSKMASGRG
jgi:putative transposase